MLNSFTNVYVVLLNEMCIARNDICSNLYNYICRNNNDNEHTYYQKEHKSFLVLFHRFVIECFSKYINYFSNDQIYFEFSARSKFIISGLGGILR